MEAWPLHAEHSLACVLLILTSPSCSPWSIHGGSASRTAVATVAHRSVMSMLLRRAVCTAFPVLDRRSGTHHRCPGCHSYASAGGRIKSIAAVCFLADAYQRAHSPMMHAARGPRKAAIPLLAGLLAALGIVLGEQYPGDVAAGARSATLTPTPTWQTKASTRSGV